MTSTDSYFIPEGEALRPVPEARSPWADDMLHGRLLAGLAARAAETERGDDTFAVTRITLDMFRFPPMTPFTVASTVTRAGGRVRVVEVSIVAAGKEVARASVLLLKTSAHPELTAWHAPAWEAPHPDTVPSNPDFVPDNGWEIRMLSDGGFWSSERKRLWTHDGWSLVAREPLSPVVRAALAADLPNPMANSGSEGLPFINADLTLFLARPPRSEWIGVEVADHVGADGIAIGTCMLYDTDGPIGSSTVCAVTNEATLSG